MIKPGPRNLITDVPGLLVGNAEDRTAWTGVTVLLAERAVIGAVDVRGGAPGTRDTDLLDPAATVTAIDAIVLAGGSEFGLEAAGSVAAALSAAGRGLDLDAPVTVPVVPAAILFDLANGGNKRWGANPPYRRLGEAALAAAAPAFELGNAGAGYGAKAGPYKGGLGSASAHDERMGVTVGALIAANPLGSPVIPGTPTFWAWAQEMGEELGGQPPPAAAPPADSDLDFHGPLARAGANTSIGVIATDAALTKAEAKRVAVMAQDGLARAIRPSHTPFDGDLLFALATGDAALPEPRAASLARLGAIAADAVARATARGVFEAKALGRYPAYREAHGAALQQG